MQSEKILQLFLKYKSVCTDTRKITPNAIYFALKGENFNGNRFANQALEQGCSFAIIDEKEFIVDERTILIEDVLTCLQNLARDYRNYLSNITIIGLTGSNGKTTTKELIRDVLKCKFNVFATHGNLNNHIGVPLSLLSVDEKDEFAIIEMGANHLKEIEFLANIALPDYGLITNIGKAHLEGFGGIEGVKKGKAELFEYLKANDKPAFINENISFVSTLVNGLKVIPYNSVGGEYKVVVTQKTPTLSFELMVKDEKYEIQSNFTGEYNIHNLMAAVKIGLYFEVEIIDIVKALSEYVPENSRSQIQKTKNNTLILDAYNANPTSLENALINLSEMEGATFFVIGDMLELGKHSESEHQSIIQLCEKLKLEGILVGAHFEKVKYSHGFNKYENYIEAKKYLTGSKIRNKTILIKGSRGIKLENVVGVL